jgi:hypothetical protein
MGASAIAVRMIVERIERPNAQPIIQPSRSKLERQAANEPDPNLYGINANQGDGAIARKRDPLDGLGAGIWRVVYVSLCVWAVIVTAWLVYVGK